MLSVGIRCGEGFDKETLRLFIERGKRQYEYDVLILGANLGGNIYAKEASALGKKVALVHWRIPTPGEEEGYDEDKEKMAHALNMDEQLIQYRLTRILEEENKTGLIGAIQFSKSEAPGISSVHHENNPKSTKWCRKVRRSRLDLKNSIKNMAEEGLIYMHKMAMKNDLSEGKNGTSYLQKISWGKMMENLLDHIIERNWTILTEFLTLKISIYKGYPVFLDPHTVKVIKTNGEEIILTAETVISAVEVHNGFPLDVIGARDFGVNFDDFFRLSTSPGKTLVVGTNAIGMACCGILASFGFPVVAVSRSTILKNGDGEMVAMIIMDLQNKGVNFMEKQSLISINLNKTGDRLVATFEPVEMNVSTTNTTYSEEFDTVLFTTKEKLNTDNSNKTLLQMEMERLLHRTFTPDEELMRAIVIPDGPGNVSLVGPKNSSGQSVMSENSDCNKCKTSQDHTTWIPNIIFTPLEYAYLGVSQEIAKIRLGDGCSEVFSGYFQTQEVISETDSLIDDVCFAKIIFLMEKNLIAGIHLMGRDAIAIMHKIIEPFKDMMLLSDLHPAIRSLMKYSQVSLENDEIMNDYNFQI